MNIEIGYGASIVVATERRNPEIQQRTTEYVNTNGKTLFFVGVPKPKAKKTGSILGVSAIL